MRTKTTPFLLVLLVVVLLPRIVRGTPYQLEYDIQIHADGSATWTIEHRFAQGENGTLFRQLSDPTYFSDVLIKNVRSLVSTAAQATQRVNMSVKNFVMTSSVLGNYSFVKYQFYWIEFADTEKSTMKIGDVFKVQGLFFYGDGTVSIAYPVDYSLESVSPQPHSESNTTLTWYGTADFKSGEPSVLLKAKATDGSTGLIGDNALPIGVLLAFVGIAAVGFYYVRWRRKEVKAKSTIKTEAPSTVLAVEGDEEKVLNLLKAAGGSSYQSTIADRCGFSRSKTSMLLAVMEKEGKITRTEKGREKIVTLTPNLGESKKTKNQERSQR